MSENKCKRCHGTGYIPSETCDMGCVDCQDKCPDCVQPTKIDLAGRELGVIK